MRGEEGRGAGRGGAGVEVVGFMWFHEFCVCVCFCGLLRIEAGSTGEGRMWREFMF